ncbi:hypothetical protein E4U17_003490 [Claviceps sp. LM77 group G4]|nr:hypothetical protein E4U17_003490 [Claviceps sp. LM77 group G4]
MVPSIESETTIEVIELSGKTPESECLPCRHITALGVLCRHRLSQRIRDKQPIEEEEIDPHWRRYRFGAPEDNNTVAGPFDPLVIRGKGRPKGSVAVDKSTDVSRTARRDPSLFEHVQAAEEAEARLHRETLNASKAPSSTAPAAIDTTRLSTTAIGLQRLEAGDSYEPGTVQPRAYMRAVNRIEDIEDDAGEGAEGGPPASPGPATCDEAGNEAPSWPDEEMCSQDASGWIYATQIPPDYEGDIDEYITKRLEEQRALLEASQDIMQSLSDVE